MTSRAQSALVGALVATTTMVALACAPGVADAWMPLLPRSIVPFWLMWGLGDTVQLPKQIVTWVAAPLLTAAALAIALRRPAPAALARAYAVSVAAFAAWVGLANHLGLWSAYGVEPLATLACIAAVGATAGLALDGCGARSLLSGMALAGLPVALYSMLQHAGIEVLAWDPAHSEPGRTISTFGNPDFFATWLAGLVPITLWRSSHASSPTRRAAWAALSALLACAVVFSYTRAAWLGLLAGVVVATACGALTWRRDAVLSFVAVGGLLCAFFLTRPPQQFTLGSRVTDTLRVDPSASVRLVLWREAARAIAQRPLMGSGLDTFSYVAMPYRYDEPPWLLSRVGLPGDPHNTFLEVAVASGLGGLLLLLTCMGVAGRAVLQALRSGGDAAPVAATVVGCGTALCLSHVFVQISIPGMWSAVLLGAVAVALRTPSDLGPIHRGLTGLLLVLGALGSGVGGWFSVRLGESEFQTAYGAGQGEQAMTLSGEEGAAFLRASWERFDGALAQAGGGMRGARVASREARLLEQLLARIDPSDKAAASFAQVVSQRGMQRASMAVQVNRFDPYVWYDLARMAKLSAEHTPDPVAAERLREQALGAALTGCRLDSNNAALASDHARLLARCGDYAAADREFARSLSLAPDQVPIMLDRAQALLDAKHPDDALAVLDEVDRLDGANARANDLRHQAQAARGNGG